MRTRLLPNSVTIADQRPHILRRILIAPSNHPRQSIQHNHAGTLHLGRIDQPLHRLVIIE